MSSDTSVNEALEAYLAGRVTAEQLTAVVAGEYYRETRNGKRETLQPIIEVIERAHPGVVELKAAPQSPGFDVRLAERPFPKQYDGALREAVERVLHTVPVSRVPCPEERSPNGGLLKRIVAAVRRLFSA
jgi:hypothetical protein